MKKVLLVVFLLALTSLFFVKTSWSDDYIEKQIMKSEQDELKRKTQDIETKSEEHDERLERLERKVGISNDSKDYSNSSWPTSSGGSAIIPLPTSVGGTVIILLPSLLGGTQK
jgi:hypothetical protein